MPDHDPSSILDRRLATEGQRRGLSPEACRELAVVAGLDAFQEQRKRQSERERLQAHVLLVTATPTERTELLAQLVHVDPGSKKVSGQLSYQQARVGSWRVAALHVDIGPFGARGAVAFCTTAREETGASLFVAVGTAFGLPDAVALGDVAVSDSVVFYDDRVVEDIDGQITERVRRAPQRASLYWSGRARDIARSEAGRALPRITVGAMLSGGAVIASEAYRDRLVAWHGASVAPSVLIGGEMEAAGLVAAAHDRDWLIVKGISDLADGASRQEEAALRQRQQQASHNAAVTVLEMLATTEREVSG